MFVPWAMAGSGRTRTGVSDMRQVRYMRRREPSQQLDDQRRRDGDDASRWSDRDDASRRMAASRWNDGDVASSWNYWNGGSRRNSSDDAEYWPQILPGYH